MALPNSIDVAAPAGSESPAGGDNEFRALKQFLVDVFGFTSATNVTSKAFTYNANGTVSWARRAELSKGADIASTAALTVGLDGNYFDITGTSTITSLSSVQAGTIVHLQFDGAAVTNYNATSLILAGLANQTWAAGDILALISEGGGNWRELWRKGPLAGRVLNLTASTNQIVLDSDAAVNTGTITMASLSAARVWTLPDATTTLVGHDATQTLTNKTITSPVLDGTYTLAGTPTLGAALAMSSAPNLGTAAAPAGTGFFTLLDLEPSSSTAGIIRWNGVNVLHIYGGGLNEESVFFGPRAGNFTITGNEAVGIGRDALAALTSGQQNVAVGSGAGIAITSGSSNVVVGSQALASLTTSGGNVAIGQNALNVTTGGKNVAIGTSAGLSLNTGSTNVLVGEQAGHQIDGGSRTGNFSGSNNVGVGYLTLANLTTGSDNNAFGTSALQKVTSGGSNTGIAGLANLTTGSSNRFLGGSNALTGGNYNSGIGEEVLNGLTTGSYCTAFGYRAGGGAATAGRATTSTDCIFIGQSAELGSSTQRANAIAIGKNGRVDADNAMGIGGTGTDAINVGIGTGTPGGGSTVGTNVLSLANGTAPVGGVANQASLYSADVSSSAELFALDEFGSTPQLTPHPSHKLDLLPVKATGPYAYPWVYTSSNQYLGKRITVDMAGLVEAVELLSGKLFTSVENLAPWERADWDTDQERRREHRQNQIDSANAAIALLKTLIASEWDEKVKAGFERDLAATRIPDAYTKKGPPKWMKDRGVKSTIQ